MKIENIDLIVISIYILIVFVNLHYVSVYSHKPIHNMITVSTNKNTFVNFMLLYFADITIQIIT
ncbi:Uncharacterised protein [Bacteroides uniformis]|uniref:Uncharacterized protein n=1 Tax=Bacteroides uniformis TaxID=820 RepID=A0A174U9H2_BACUN|nr:Uncharacterised protein [Bacteroides uniformis]